MNDQWSDPTEFLRMCGVEEWSLERAEKMAKSFNTPLHKNFQMTCEHARKLITKIHELRGKLSHYETVEPFNL